MLLDIHNFDSTSNPVIYFITVHRCIIRNFDVYAKEHSFSRMITSDLLILLADAFYKPPKENEFPIPKHRVL